MPKNPLDSLLDTVGKIQEIHSKAEQVRRSLDSIDPLATATTTLNGVTQKINQLDAVLASTRKRNRRLPPRQE